MEKIDKQRGIQNIIFSGENKKTRISVVVISYNQERYIDECLNGIFMQKGDFTVELVIGDDCSTDGTLEVIKNYTGNYTGNDIQAKILVADKNIGMTKNLQRCLNACTGDYIAVCEGDDYWVDSFKLQKQVHFLQANPDCAICFNSVNTYFQNTGEFSFFKPDTKLFGRVFNTSDLVKENFIGNLSCCMYNAKYIEKIPPDFFDLHIGAWMFNIYYSRFGKIGYIKDVMSVYRKHDSRIRSAKTSRVDVMRLYGYIYTYNRFLSYEFNEEFSEMQKKLKNIFENTLMDIAIIDDIAPHPLSAFRMQEFFSYMENFERSIIYCSGLSVPLLGGKSLDELVYDFLKKYPKYAGQIDILKPNTVINAKLIYTVFLENAYVSIDEIERTKTPFVFCLYPGGSFGLNNARSDAMLRRVTSSPCFRKVIVTQKITYDYLIEKKFCHQNQIEFIFGVVTPLKQFERPYEGKRHFGVNKDILDICFVAHKYTEMGVDKGYDVFVQVATVLAEKHPNIRFHVVGGFDKNVFDVSQINDRITFYGTQETEWFDDFYLDKDLILSPNIPFKIFDGFFDGFPTGSCTDAGLRETAIFCTDVLKLNQGFFEDGREIVIIPHDVMKIVEKIEYYYSNPDKLFAIGKYGRQKIIELYAYEAQIAPRVKLLQDEIDAFEKNKHEISNKFDMSEADSYRVNTKVNRPKVSIVCITYNHGTFIAKALDGFVSQKTDFPFEAIVADDFSNDNTRSIIAEYAKKYPNIIKPILREKNIGSLPNYVDALSRAEGQYLAICDGDDYWTDNLKLQKQVDFLDSNPDCSMCCHPFLQTYIDKSVQDKIITPWDFVSEDVRQRGYLTIKDLFPVNPIGSLTVMYRWSLRNKTPGWMKDYHIGDLVLHLLHADKGRIGVIDEVMAVYQRHANGVWFGNETREKQRSFAVEYANLLTDLDHELDLKYTDVITPCKGRPLKILFIAMENSIHSYQWIQAVLKENHHVIQLYSSYSIPEKPALFNSMDKIQIYSLSSDDLKNHPIKGYLKFLFGLLFHPIHTMRLMRNGTFGYGSFIRTTKFKTVLVYLKLIAKMFLRPKQMWAQIKYNSFGLGGMVDKKDLDTVIKKFQPDIIHTLHTQTSGYMLMNVRKNWLGKFPIWIHSVWGSDIYLWERIPGQKEVLRELVSYIDYFISEGKRDQVLAKNLGYMGKFIEPMPATGGFDIEKIKSLKLLKPSLRKEIAVKGYDRGVGRFRDAISGIIRARDVLQDYTINVFSLEMSTELLGVYAADSGLNINIIPYGSYEDIISMYSRSKIYIGCSFSDGTPASFLEALAYGAFPIQTNTADTDAWIVDGETAILVPPDDPLAVELAIRRVITDDELVDAAAEINFQTISMKANNKQWVKTIQKIYNSIGYAV